MSTPKQRTPMQRALNEYSLAVQKYGQLVQQLPASLRPTPFDRFRHRGNISAIRRRTEEVIQATKRLQKAAAGSKVLSAKSATTDAVKETAQDITADAKPTMANSGYVDEPMAANSGHGHGGIDSTMDIVTPTGIHQHDAGDGHQRHNVLVKDPGASWSSDAQIAGENGGIHPSERGQFTHGEVELLIRIATASSDAALIYARRIRQMMSHGGTAEDIQEVLETVIRWVEGGGFGNGREGGGQ
ncbi:hypothetical protein FN846DRAFT_912297 [Sphaerosporella brunnea]|uniref:Uncharacterized protein n=1 Tax=Sphaerosporella brunnea TaxID=1250544 RepID=A0A5J5EIV5_9PEZI|nr:hypothetical protein FN846DRAFT_912295 [Sphaerosporella brunnea]KAA8894959.1 hypothetical protein FN846DRAFT_912297 [Sphaerosporella brunnea]